MIKPMPGYAGYNLYVGEFPAEGGAFYSPAYGHTLSKLANRVYGVGTLTYVLWINKAMWNRQNCVYRVDSTSCKSQVVDSSQVANQSSWGGPWIALCPRDVIGQAAAMGLAYPIIWVPAFKGDEPQPGLEVEFGDPILPEPEIPEIPGISLVIPPIGDGEDTPEPPGEEQHAGIGEGIPWWAWLLLIGGGGGLGYYLYRRGKRG